MYLVDINGNQKYFPELIKIPKTSHFEEDTIYLSVFSFVLRVIKCVPLHYNASLYLLTVAKLQCDLI